MGLVRILNLLWKQFRRKRMRKLEGFELDHEEENDNSSRAFQSLFVWLKNFFLFSRWICFYRLCFKSFSSYLVYCWTILDLEYSYA